MDIQETYTEGEDISIYYEFVSESDFQPCRIQVWDLADLSVPVWDNNDNERENRGHLSFLLGEGAYRMEFTLLSSREGKLNALSFLSDTRDFLVEAP